MKITYLATCYTHADRVVRERRYHIVNEVAARLMIAGRVVFSPITHGHAMCDTASTVLPLEWDFWQQQCDPFLSVMHELIVLTQDGWTQSVGVAYEIAAAERRGVPRAFMDGPEDLR